MSPREPVDPTSLRVAVFGGSFDPPHVGHVLAALYVLKTAPVDRVLVVPVFKHAFDKHLVPFASRLALAEAAFAGLTGVEVSSVERDLGSDSLTLRTLEHLRASNPGWQMRLVVGSDVLGDLDKWHRFDLVRQIAPPLVLPRAGWVGDPSRALLPDVSSTRVRELVARGDASVAELVPSAVLELIERERLYGSPGR